MRNLEFRAWWKDTMEPIPDFMEQYTIDVLDDSPDNPFIHSQFTGLLDCEGHGIWEGDILEFDGYEWGGRDNREVVEWKNREVVEWKNGEFIAIGLSRSEWSQWCKVIGNIYENPTLLGGKP